MKMFMIFLFLAVSMLVSAQEEELVINSGFNW